jgi:DNA helicase-2/ATP-dependent DNA helicase PcrA
MPPYSTRNPRPMQQQPSARRTWAPQQPAAPIERPSYSPSQYQQAIINWLMTGTGNALVDAKAGSGKTSTLCMLSDVIPNDARTRAAFLAFNRPIADELKRRLPSHVQAATWHSVCRSALLRMPEFARFANVRSWVNGSKFHVLFDMIVNTYMDGEKFRSGTKQLVGLMKANALLPDCMDADIMTLIEHFEIDFDEASADGGVEQGVRMAREVLTLNNSMLDVIDFDDMLYFAYIMNAPLMKYTHVFIDEAQDTNLIQRRLLARLLSASSRLIAVGDPQQAIYGFRGADSEAMNNIADEFACERFPLSISYRCPRKVIALAQRIVPAIEARENAPEGTVKKLDTFNLSDFTSKDLVVCRNTAPLISLGFRFLRAHKPVRIMGREIGEQLVSLIQKMRAADVEQLADSLDTYTNREIEKALKKRQENRAEQLGDQRDAVIAIIEGLPEGARTVYEVIAVIRKLFTDEGAANQTTLSTVHKAKGMESHTVFILDGHLMPSKWAKQAWQQVQEQNLKYVAVTRALDSLFFVKSTQIQ